MRPITVYFACGDASIRFVQDFDEVDDPLSSPFLCPVCEVSRKHRRPVAQEATEPKRGRPRKEEPLDAEASGMLDALMQEVPQP